MIGSVVIPAYNRTRRLRRAVESVLVQTFREFELVVVDDASTEDLSGVRELIESAGHRWLRFDGKRGPSAARNAGAAATTGEWIAFLDSDDCWRPEKLEVQIAWHRANPEIAISQCEEVWIRNGVRVKKPDHLRQPETGRVFELCTERCCISPSCTMLLRELWNRFGGFDESLWTCEDYELWLRISRENEVGLVPGNWVEKHGGHPDQMSYSFPANDRWRVLALIKLMDSCMPAEDYTAVIKAIATKAGILAKGARKRENAEAELYESIEGWARTAIDSRSEAKLPVQFRVDLEKSIHGQFGFRGSLSQADGS